MRLRGTVKWYNPDKRMGYISRNDEVDVFVHQSGLDGVKELTKEQVVSFEIEETEKGPKAVRVRVEKQ
ncbi:MAG: cold shock domain-containing protein [Anaerolineae bacterium]